MLVAASVASRLFEVPLPDALAAGPRSDAIVSRLTDTLVEQLLYRRMETPELWKLNRFRLAVRERWQDKVRYVLRTLFLPRPQDFALLALPDSVFPAYYLVRAVHDYLALPIWHAALRIAGGRSRANRPAAAARDR